MPHAECYDVPTVRKNGVLGCILLPFQRQQLPGTVFMPHRAFASFSLYIKPWLRVTVTKDLLSFIRTRQNQFLWFNLKSNWQGLGTRLSSLNTCHASIKCLTMIARQQASAGGCGKCPGIPAWDFSLKVAGVDTQFPYSPQKKVEVWGKPVCVDPYRKENKFFFSPLAMESFQFDEGVCLLSLPFCWIRLHYFV